MKYVVSLRQCGVWVEVTKDRFSNGADAVRFANAAIYEHKIGEAWRIEHEAPVEQTDLKLIDELLVGLKQELAGHTRCRGSDTWAFVEQSSSVANAAMRRLRQAWKSGEASTITASLAAYFQSTGAN